MPRFTAYTTGKSVVVGYVGQPPEGGGRVEEELRPIFTLQVRLRVVSNFGDGDCGAGEKHTRARAKVRGDAISSAPQSPSPKLETTRSLPPGL